jgi:hypothetical protein
MTALAMPAFQVPSAAEPRPGNSAIKISDRKSGARLIMRDAISGCGVLRFVSFKPEPGASLPASEERAPRQVFRKSGAERRAPSPAIRRPPEAFFVSIFNLQ